MGKARPSQRVALICAVCSADTHAGETAEISLVEQWGPAALVQAPFPFDHTDYYEAEMGAPLSKHLVAFERLIEPEELPACKLSTNRLEEELSKDGRRRVNLDPGYLTPARLVLASTKDFAHRIYLGGGIYGEVTLLYRKGAFTPLPWTYPDYRGPATLTFLKRVRSWYLDRLADL